MRTNISAIRALLFCGALVPAGLAAQQDSPAPPPQARQRIKVIRTDTTRDSNFVRITINTDDIARQIHELMASREMERVLAQSMREATGQTADSKKLRELGDRLDRLAQKNAALMTTIEMSCAGDRQPEGWLGVQFSELQTVMGEDAPMMPSLREYPKIDSVYSNSPASKAGVRRGDVVTLIGGQDARRPVQLDKLLRPTTRVPLRVQRDGSQKELTLVVEKKPADFNSECANVEQFISPDFDQPMIYMRTPRPAAAPRVGISMPRTPTAPDAPAPPAMPFASGFSFAVPSMNSAIAGATLQALDDDSRVALGVDNGVLVTKVLPGTPSKDSGLHAIDVIVSADGQNVASVRSLYRIISNAKSNAVKLQVIRAGKPLTLVLHWKDSPERPDD
jgi:S1-C subfamily serine protease